MEPLGARGSQREPDKAQNAGLVGTRLPSAIFAPIENWAKRKLSLHVRLQQPLFPTRRSSRPVRKKTYPSPYRDDQIKRRTRGIRRQEMPVSSYGVSSFTLWRISFTLCVN